jgi:hypothetical protein
MIRYSRTLTTAVSGYTPGPRMVAVGIEPFTPIDQPERVGIFPVLGFELRVERSYHKEEPATEPTASDPFGRDKFVPGTHEELLEAGWKFWGERVRRVAVCLLPCGRTTETETADCGALFELIACHWPADQDAERLADVVSRHECEYAEGAERRQAMAEAMQP